MAINDKNKKNSLKYISLYKIGPYLFKNYIHIKINQFTYDYFIYIYIYKFLTWKGGGRGAGGERDRLV